MTVNFKFNNQQTTKSETSNYLCSGCKLLPPPVNPPAYVPGQRLGIIPDTILDFMSKADVSVDQSIAQPLTILG